MQTTNHFMSSTLFSQFIFLLTGVVTTIGSQYLYYLGGSESSLLLPVVANYYGMSLGYFMPAKKETNIAPRVPISSVNSKIWGLAIMDFVGCSLSILGITYAGSGIFQVMYSSVVVWTAIWSTIFLKKKLGSSQWYAIFVVTGGLMLSALGSANISWNYSQPQDTDTRALLRAQRLLATESAVAGDGSWLSLFGIICTFACTLMFSFHYVLTESVLTVKNAPAPKDVQSWAGFYAAIIVTVYQLVYSVPRWQTLFVDKAVAAGGHFGTIAFMYLILLLSAFGHGITYFALLGSVGSVSTGILQSLRAVSVFAISAWLFCSAEHPNQCFNFSKGLSTCVVVCGILYFSKASASYNATKQKKEPTDLQEI